MRRPTTSTASAALYRLPERYLLFVGTVEPRKNLRRLAEAIVAARRSAAARRRRRRRLGRRGHRRGRRRPVPRLRAQRRLWALYAGADVFCYPSVREGYGLPVLEAMAQGTPVVTSIGTATEEAAGGAAVLVDPNDTDRHRPRHQRGDRRREPSSPSDGRHACSAGDVAQDRRAHRRRLSRARRRCSARGRDGSPVRCRRQPAVVRARARSAAPRSTSSASCSGWPTIESRRSCRRCSCCPASPPPTPSWPACSDSSRRRSTVATALRRISAEQTLARPPDRATATLVHHGGGTAPSTGAAADRAHDPRPAVPHVPAVLQPRSSARYLDWAMPRSVTRADGHRRAQRVRPRHGGRRVLGRSGLGGGGAPRHRADARRSTPPPSELRERYGLGDGPVIVLPGDDPPAQGPPVPPRADGHALDRPRSAAGADRRRRSRRGRGGGDDRAARPGSTGRAAGSGPGADRNGLLRMADAMVFPSEYEGFGAPVIEAMALGTPVVCSDRTCLPEVVGDAALVLPLDLDAWAGALDDASTPTAPSSSRPGATRAAAFTSAAIGARRCSSAYGQALRMIERHRAHRRALPALRARHRADRRGDDAHRPRARRARPRDRTWSRRCRGTASTQSKPEWARSLDPHARRRRGDRSPACTRFPGTTSATCSAGRSASPASARSPARGGDPRRPGRRGARDVAAAHHRPHRLG